MPDARSHRLQRGIVSLEPDAVVPREVTYAEGPALVTYHRPRYVLWQGRPAIEFGLPVMATWVPGDGTWHRPPSGGGGRPSQAHSDRRAA